ncbi:COX15/CtaA family protein [Acidovorax sp. NCPPB 4044]|uniref:COX15/CtaA family protein n=1 Tax=Acidovorax sp. NCPPB 4044 TaxID=2940490 RepID=UPI002303A8F7|nr:COX15/CtaA family protein [Acidovorax sp. NCPPB 4044]MDA8522243.1 COX15/CtaA family protein [Acidovorax sp. NCPPB 4044]
MNAAAQPLYDLAPLAELMLLGVLIALGPLAWVAWRNRHGTTVHRWQALAILTLFLTFDLVLFGAFTRLTDSGLGCPDWPGCYGNASPLGAHAEISAAQEAMPTGPVTHRKAWVEMVHRYLASGVGVLIIVLTAGAWAQWRRARAGGGGGDRGGPAARDRIAVSPWWPTATLVWVCLQGAFGAWTVTMKLFPAIVTLHLIGGLVLLALLCVQAVRQTLASRGEAPAVLPRGLRAGLIVTALLVGLQIVLGGWVSTNYAVLACTTFPTCQGSWWPDMAFQEGFQIWRPLGLLQDGNHITFAGLTAIHYAHRLAAYAVLGAIALLVWRLRRAQLLTDPARWLAGLALLQFATGLSNVVLDWPLVAAVLHTGGAAALVVVLTWALAASRSAHARDKMSIPRPVPAAAGAPRIPTP